MTDKRLTPEEIVKSFKDEFKTKIRDAQIKKRTAGSKKNEFVNIWMKIDKSIFKKTVKHPVNLATLDRELIFHFIMAYV